VSRICAGLDEVVTAFRTRRLDHTTFPYVNLDATYLHVRNPASQVVSVAVVIATGITADGGRKVLGLDVSNSKDEVF
jgi:putative transposase